MQNSEEYIVPTRIMSSIIKFLYPSESTGVFPKVFYFITKPEDVLKRTSRSCKVCKVKYQFAAEVKIKHKKGNKSSKSR